MPEEAKRHAARGEILFAEAKKPQDYLAAVAEMNRATWLASWWPRLFFNAGLAYEGANSWTEAANSYRAYLRLHPGAEDAEDVKRKLYEMELRAERK